MPTARVPKVRTAVTAATMVLAALLTGCSSSNVIQSGYTSTTEAPKYPPVPTVDDLKAELTTGLDPNVPLDQKVGMFQGLQADPALINRAASAIAKNGVTFDVTRITDAGNGTLSVAVNFVTNGNPNSGTVPFIAEDGVWKVQKSWVCNLVRITQSTSPACQ